MRNKIKIAVIGLGYVDYHLRSNLKEYYTYGFDINRKEFSTKKY